MFLSGSFGIFVETEVPKEKQAPGVDQKPSTSWANRHNHRGLVQINFLSFYV